MSLTITKISDMSRHIQEDTTRMLWAVSAGVCEFQGCTNRLYTHHITKENVNLSKRAHIYAFSEGGRRFSRLRSREKINDIDNLMLLCENCHQLIDSQNTNYSAEELISMKKEHEERIALLVGIKPNLQSEVIIYNNNVGENSILISDFHAMESITPDYYPVRKEPINLSPDLKLNDNESGFWDVMCRDLDRRLSQYELSIRDKHISLFAIAPQPLLFKLGTLLNRNYDVDVRQTQGDVTSWRWTQEGPTIELNLFETYCGEVYDKAAITLEITARLSDEEIRKVLDERRVFRIIASDCSPTAIKSKIDLLAVIQKYREALNKIRLECASNVQVALLPIAPASVSIEAGRQLMKGDPSMTLYDRNYLTKEWMPALSFYKMEGKHD